MEIAVLNDILFWELMFFVVMNVIWISIYFKFRGRGNITTELKSYPSVSVIIPVFNKVKHVKEAINSALSLDYKNKNVIVVNDGSIDGSEAVCRRFEKRGLIKFINFKKNQGKSYALNAGIRASESEFILTIDADSFIESEALGQMIRHFGDPKIGAVAGVVRIKNNKGILQRLQFIEYFQQSFQRLVQGLFRSVLVLPGPISLYRKEAIIKSGYFENTTLAEDWDMTMKVHKSGYGVVSEKSAYADTYALDTARGWWRQRIRWSRGGIQIARKHKDSLSKIDNRVMKRFIFPIHLIWIVVPVIAMPLAILFVLPAPAAFAAFMGSMGGFFDSLFGWLFAGIQTTIVGLYSMIDIAIFNFVEFNNFSLLKIVSMLTGLAFLTFTFISLKTFKKDFTPKNFFVLMFMPIYWLMLNIVFLYSLASEVLKRKAVW